MDYYYHMTLLMAIALSLSLPQNLSVAPAPLGSSHSLPSLCHLHLKSCAVPDLPTFSAAPAVEWLSLDNCDMSVYAPDIVLLWPGLSWLEITYTHQVCESENRLTREVVYLSDTCYYEPHYFLEYPFAFY